MLQYEFTIPIKQVSRDLEQQNDLALLSLCPIRKRVSLRALWAFGTLRSLFTLLAALTLISLLASLTLRTLLSTRALFPLWTLLTSLPLLFPAPPQNPAHLAPLVDPAPPVDPPPLALPSPHENPVDPQDQPDPPSPTIPDASTPDTNTNGAGPCQHLAGIAGSPAYLPQNRELPRSLKLGRCIQQETRHQNGPYLVADRREGTEISREC